MNEAEQAKAALEQQVGTLLIIGAIECQTELKKSMNRKFPPASKPGEFLARRTGNAQLNAGYEPVEPAEAGAAGKVAFGFSKAGDYAGAWEVFGERLGLAKTVENMADRLETLFSQVPPL